MTQNAHHTTPASLVHEFAAELTPSPAEIAAAYGPRPALEPAQPNVRPVQHAETALPSNLNSVLQIPVLIKVVLGSATMPVANLANLARGATIALDRRVGEPVDVVVNGRIVARGEVVVLDEDSTRFGISLTEIVTSAAGTRQAGR